MKKLLCLVPLLILLSCGNPRIERLPDSTETGLTDYLRSRHMSPADLILRSSEDSRGVLLTGTRGLQSDITLLRYLVPVLHDAGHPSMALWFLHSGDEERIEAFMSGSDESITAEDLLFRADPARAGYTEYRDFLDYLKAFNAALPENSTFRVSGLPPLPDQADPFLVYTIPELPVSSGTRDRVLIHNPLQNSSGHWEIPFQGGLVHLMIHKWSLYRYSGILLSDSPFGDLYLTIEDRDAGRKVSEQYDGLILMGDREIFQPLSLLEGFINEGNTAAALESFPDQWIREQIKPAAYLMNRKLSSRHNRLTGVLEDMEVSAEEHYPQ